MVLPIPMKMAEIRLLKSVVLPVSIDCCEPWARNSGVEKKVDALVIKLYHIVRGVAMMAFCQISKYYMNLSLIILHKQSVNTSILKSILLTGVVSSAVRAIVYKQKPESHEHESKFSLFSLNLRVHPIFPHNISLVLY